MKIKRSIIILLFALISSIAFSQQDKLIVLKQGKPINVDGVISSNEWTDADSLFIEIEAGCISTVYYKQDGSHVLFAFKNLEKVSGKPHVVDLFIDKSNHKCATWDSDDLWLHTSFSDCEAIGKYYVWSSCTKTDKPDWLANNLPFSNGNDNIEMQINLSKFDLKTAQDTLGFSICLGTKGSKVDPYWPATADIDKPSTWGYLVFPKLGNTGIPDDKKR